MKKKKTKFYELKVHLGLFIFHGYLIPHPFWRLGFGATHREREREREREWMNLKPRICCKKYCECCISKKNKNNNKSLVSKFLLVFI